jgi:hypothetical protein
MVTDSSLQLWAAVWLATALYLLVRHWRPGAGVGLVLTYVLSFGMLHWVAAVLYLLPWYSNPGFRLTTEGLHQSAYAMLSLAAGSELACWIVRRRQAGREVASGQGAVVDPRLVTMYLVVGAALYALVTPFAGKIPSVSAIISSGSTLVVVGFALKCWNNWLNGQRIRLYLWLAASSVLPFVTVVAQGFLGFGFASMLTIFVFVAAFYRPRWRTIAVGVLMTYVGLSVYVTYMRDRREIRDVVWAGAAMQDRVDQLTATLSSAEWFDWHNPAHLNRIDERLNQDYLIGAAVEYLGRGAVSFAHGDTLIQAVEAVIPRALWPNKPVAAGSGNLVSTYTGILFAEGTSVGIGQVLEWYVNFGTRGVVIGFFLIGLVITFVDRTASRWLHLGNLRRFTYWYLPGISLLQIEGSLVDVMSTAAGALVVAFLLGHITSTREPYDEELGDESALPIPPSEAPGGPR